MGESLPRSSSDPLSESLSAVPPFSLVGDRQAGAGSDHGGPAMHPRFVGVNFAQRPARQHASTTTSSGIGSRGRGPDQPRSFLRGFAEFTAANASAIGSARCAGHLLTWGDGPSSGPGRAGPNLLGKRLTR